MKRKRMFSGFILSICLCCTLFTAGCFGGGVKDTVITLSDTEINKLFTDKVLFDIGEDGSSWLGYTYNKSETLTEKVIIKDDNENDKEVERKTTEITEITYKDENKTGFGKIAITTKEQNTTTNEQDLYYQIYNESNEYIVYHKSIENDSTASYLKQSTLEYEMEQASFELLYNELLDNISDITVKKTISGSDSSYKYDMTIQLLDGEYNIVFYFTSSNKLKSWSCKGSTSIKTEEIECSNFYGEIVSPYWFNASDYSA